jgi:acyl-CoA reductase-like NAD-dependent aldehyde dehydrogenase
MVDCISFTGSTAVGKAIALQASTTLKRTILELGGKSVQLYLPDTFSAGNYDHVVYGAMTVFIANCGQGCALQTRMLVPEAHKAAVVAAVTTLAGSLPVGDPSDSANVIGPLISQEHRERVHRIVTESIKVGAKLTAGGRYPPGLKTGWFYEPTVLDVEDSNTPAVRQEIFGPVITIQGYRDIDHAIELANDGQYGLSGGIYTGDLKKGLSVAEKIRSGTVQINTTWASGYTPMGGIKQSGYGSERGVAGIRAFQYLKHLVIGSA